MVFKKHQGVRLEWAAANQVGFCIEGEVIIKEKAQKTLHKYKLHSKEIMYQEMWSEHFPHGVDTASVIAVKYQEPLLQDKRSTTLLLSNDGKILLDSWQHEGILLTCFLDKAVYAVEKTSGEYEIVIVDIDDRSETRLQPVAAKPTWSHTYLSVCGYEAGTVVASKDRTLDIYRWKGR